MSINDVSLFGTLVEDVVPRKNKVGQAFAIFHVRTYKFVRDRLTGKPREHSVVHEVQCYDEAAIAPLGAHGKSGAWVRVRGEIAYKENREMFVRVPTRGGMTIVSAYFGTGITPSNPYRSPVVSGSEEVLQESFQPPTADQTEQTSTTTATPASVAETDTAGGHNPEEARVPSSETDQLSERVVASKSALDELHSGAGDPTVQSASKTSTQTRPTAPSTRSSLPGVRRSQDALAASGPVETASVSPAATPRPTAPSSSFPRTSASSSPKQASAFPGRLPGGMPRSTAAASPDSRSASSSSAKPPDNALPIQDIPF